MERLLEIFIDEVKFIVFLKPIPFLLGEKREGKKEGGERRERNIRWEKNKFEPMLVIHCIDLTA